MTLPLWTFRNSTHGMATACVAFFGLMGNLNADWPQFRGQNASSVHAIAKPPETFSGPNRSNVAWKVDLPGRGVSSPIIVGDQIIATSSDGVDQRRISVTSVSLTSGQILWRQEMVARGRPYTHPVSANAAPTPASDGERIFAFFSSNDIACYDLKGNLVWYRAIGLDHPKVGNDFGMSSSPIVIDGAVVLLVDCQGDAFATGLDAKTGETLWKTSRVSPANWSSPLATESPDGKPMAVLQSDSALTAVAPRSGVQLWSMPLSCATIPSVIAESGRLFVPTEGLTAVNIPVAGKQPETLWESDRAESTNSSPVAFDGGVYTVKGSVLMRSDLVNGNVSWQMRLPEGGTFWTTPVIAAGKMYLFAEDGKCFVVKLAKDKGELLQTNELGESVYGSPAVEGNALYVRSVSALWKLSGN